MWISDKRMILNGDVLEVFCKSICFESRPRDWPFLEVLLSFTWCLKQILRYYFEICCDSLNKK